MAWNHAKTHPGERARGAGRHGHLHAPRVRSSHPHGHQDIERKPAKPKKPPKVRVIKPKKALKPHKPPKEKQPRHHTHRGKAVVAQIERNQVRRRIRY